MRDAAHYQELVARALAFMRAHLAEPLTAPAVAKAVSYSPSRLRAIFRAVTGEGVRPNLLRLRMEKAKALLRETDLNVTEIALEVGFNSYTQFAAAFSRRAGMHASAFRRRARGPGGTGHGEAGADLLATDREWRRDDFETDRIRAHWKPIEGEWRQARGHLAGRSSGNLLIGFDEPLPENFRIEFEFRFRAEPGLPPSDMVIGLRDAAFAAEYGAVVLGARDNRLAELRLRGVVKAAVPNIRVRTDGWQRVTVELRDDTLRGALDGAELAEFRDPFPLPYARRCKLILGSWRSALRVRRFRIHDLGFAPLIRPIRQGDALFNAGLFDRARDFYTRHLSDHGSAGEMLELRYKVGMCHLAQSEFGQARGWLAKVVSVQRDPFWARHARLAELETDWHEGLEADFLARMRALWEEAALRDGVRETADRACADLEWHGFFEQAIPIRNQLLQLDADNAALREQARFRLARACQECGRLEAAERAVRQVLAAVGERQTLALEALRVLVQVLALQGRFDESNLAIAEIRRRTQNLSALRDARLHEALNLHGQGQSAQALRVLDELAAERIPDLPGAGSHALIRAALLRCGMGRLDEARPQVERWKRMPGRRYPPRARAGRVLYPVYVLAGDYETAARHLLEPMRRAAGELSAEAAQAVMAGLVLAAGGNPKQAHTIWNEVVRRYPPTRCHLYATLADALLHDGFAPIEEYPLHPSLRSELLFLAARWREACGDRKAARRLFERCIREDPTRRWPAMTARRALGRRPARPRH